MFLIFSSFIFLLIGRTLGNFQVLYLVIVIEQASINVIPLRANEIRYFDGTYYDTYNQDYILLKGMMVEMEENIIYN